MEILENFMKIVTFHKDTFNLYISKGIKGCRNYLGNVNVLYGVNTDKFFSFSFSFIYLFFFFGNAEV
jgi:hypothetical protein